MTFENVFPRRYLSSNKGCPSLDVAVYLPQLVNCSSFGLSSRQESSDVCKLCSSHPPAASPSATPKRKVLEVSYFWFQSARASLISTDPITCLGLVNPSSDNCCCAPGRASSTSVLSVVCGTLPLPFQCS